MIKTIITDIYVRATPSYWPRNWPKLDDKEKLSLCKDLIKSIERHCDCDSVSFVIERENQCEFCGSVADPNEYECCDKALQEHEAVSKAEAKDE